jgi:hypothetical protein
MPIPFSTNDFHVFHSTRRELSLLGGLLGLGVGRRLPRRSLSLDYADLGIQKSLWQKAAG